MRIMRAGIRDVQIEQRGNQVATGDNQDGGFRRGIDAGVNHGKVKRQQGAGHVRVDQRPAEYRAEDDRADRQSFDPAIGGDQFFRRQQLGQDAVFCRRVGRRTKTDNGVGEQRMHAKQHGNAADDLDGVGDQHHLALGHGVGKSADKGRQHDIRKHEKKLEQWRHPVRGMELG